MVRRSILQEKDNDFNAYAPNNSFKICKSKSARKNKSMLIAEDLTSLLQDRSIRQKSLRIWLIEDTT